MPRRDPAKAQRWRELIEAHSTSGLTVRAFCRERELSEHAFHAWRRKFRKQDAESSQPESSSRPGFAEIRIEGRDAGELQPSLTLELPGGIIARLPLDVPAETLTKVLTAAHRARPRTC